VPIRSTFLSSYTCKLDRASVSFNNRLLPKHETNSTTASTTQHIQQIPAVAYETPLIFKEMTFNSPLIHQILINVLLVTLLLSSEIEVSSAFHHAPVSFRSSSLLSQNSPSVLCAKKADMQDIVSISRRNIFEKALTASVLSTVPFLGYVPSASALLDPAVALRNVKRGQNQLVGFENMVYANDYRGVQSGLRDAPFSEIRRNIGTLIREDTLGKPEGFISPLTVDYETFKKSIEGLNAKATQGANGKKGVDMKSPYNEATASLARLVKFADSFMPPPPPEVLEPEPAPAPVETASEESTAAPAPVEKSSEESNPAPAPVDKPSEVSTPAPAPVEKPSEVSKPAPDAMQNPFQ